MQFPHQLFKQAGLNSADVGALCGVSRVTGHRWLKGVGRNGLPGVGVNIFLQGRVAKVIAPLQAAVDDGALPDGVIAKLPPPKRMAKLKSIINQYRQKK